MTVTNLLLLPGLDGTSDLFRPFLRALPKEVRSEAPIYPHDRVLSYEDLAKLVRDLIFESEPFVSKPFVLLAESFSTPLAIQIAAEHPPNLKGLVLCAGFARSPIRGLLQRFSWMVAPVLPRISLSPAAVRSVLVGNKAPSSLVESVRTAIGSVDPEVLAARLRAVLTCDVRSYLSAISVPILYLQPNDDRLVKRRCVKEIQRLRRDARVLKMDGPHLLLQREPEKSAESIAAFLHELS